MKINERYLILFNGKIIQEIHGTVNATRRFESIEKYALKDAQNDDINSVTMNEYKLVLCDKKDKSYVDIVEVRSFSSVNNIYRTVVYTLFGKQIYILEDDMKKCKQQQVYIKKKFAKTFKNSKLERTITLDKRKFKNYFEVYKYPKFMKQLVLK